MGRGSCQSIKKGKREGGFASPNERLSPRDSLGASPAPKSPFPGKRGVERFGKSLGSASGRSLLPNSVRSSLSSERAACRQGFLLPPLSLRIHCAYLYVRLQRYFLRWKHSVYFGFKNNGLNTADLSGDSEAGRSRRPTIHALHPKVPVPTSASFPQPSQPSLGFPRRKSSILAVSGYSFSMIS